MRRIILTKIKDKNGEDALFDAVVNVKKDSVNDIEKIAITATEEKEIGSIYAVRVRDCVPNINACFVEYLPGKNAFLPMPKDFTPVFLNPKQNDKICCGDIILVQKMKAKVKSKEAFVSTRIGSIGPAIFMQRGKFNVNFIGVLKEKKMYKKFRCDISQRLKQFENSGYAFVIRHSALNMTPEEIVAEAKKDIKETEALIDEAKKRYARGEMKIPSCISEGQYLYKLWASQYKDSLESVITDSPELENEARELFSKFNMNVDVRLYNDKRYSLTNLYGLDKCLETALSRKVYLKSGGYLVFDYTEAMTVIDVNSGKQIGGRDKERVVFELNKEAALEIIKQVFFRNLSGIIIVDFIGMEDPKHKEELISFIKERTESAPLLLKCHDFTKLGLMEITRQKIGRPIYEILS